jgi:hypothetical protein
LLSYPLTGTCYNNRKTGVFKVLDKAITLGIKIKNKLFAPKSRKTIKFILIILWYNIYLFYKNYPPIKNPKLILVRLIPF